MRLSGWALDKVHRSEYQWLSGQEWRYIRGQKYC
jgi:hypothetical protein